MNETRRQAERARDAFLKLSTAADRTNILRGAVQAIRKNAPAIFEANARDLAEAKAKIAEPLYKRLVMNEAKLRDVVDGQGDGVADYLVEKTSGVDMTRPPTPDCFFAHLPNGHLCKGCKVEKVESVEFVIVKVVVCRARAKSLLGRHMSDKSTLLALGRDR